jgi:TetR/AcrR family transcriptional regulator, acrAB operon repressor
MRKTKEEAAITRKKLLTVALSVFSIKGYSVTTLEDIAREAGVTRGAIYWHFKGKAEIYNSLLHEFSERIQVITQQAISEGGTFKEVLERVFVCLLTILEDDKDLRAIMEMTLFKTAISPELESGRKEQIESSRILITGITQAMQQGIDAGELRSDLDPVDMARSFLALQNGIIYQWLADPGSFSLKNTATALAKILMAGIEKPRHPKNKTKGGRK